MMRSLYNGVAGVKTHGYGMDLLANNIANINTSGYKAAVPEFKDVFYQTSFEAGTNLGANQVGLAATGLSSAFSQAQGIMQITDRPLDMALEGRGFFAIKDADGVMKFTRNGDFGLDRQSMLTDNFGRYVLGTMNAGFRANTMSAELAKSYGINDPNGFSINNDLDVELAAETAQTPLHLPSTLFAPPEPTTVVEFGGNLNSQSKEKHINEDLAQDVLSMQMNDDNTAQTISAQGIEPGQMVIFNLNRGDGLVRMSAIANEDGVASLVLKNRFADENFSAILSKKEQVAADNIFRHKIINQAGIKQDLEITLKRVEILESGGIIYDAKALIKDKNGQIVSSSDGQVRFNSDGSLAASTLNKIGSISLKMGSAVDKSKGDAVGGFDGLTSITSLENEEKRISSDGSEGGILRDYSVDIHGNILANFTNGKSAAIAKVAVYNFINEQGLHKDGENEFVQTIDSGEAMFYRDSSGKVFLPAKIKGSFLEQSNVQLSTELTSVIAFQKAYEASAKSITTADQMLKRAIEMKK